MKTPQAGHTKILELTSGFSPAVLDNVKSATSRGQRVKKNLTEQLMHLLASKLYENISALSTRMFIGCEDFAVLKISSHEKLFNTFWTYKKMY
jgi:hypothetical protein